MSALCIAAGIIAMFAMLPLASAIEKWDGSPLVLVLCSVAVGLVASELVSRED